MYMDQATPRSANGPVRRHPYDDSSHLQTRPLMTQRGQQRPMSYEQQVLSQQQMNRGGPIQRRHGLTAYQIVSMVESRIYEMNRWLTLAKVNTPRLELHQLYDISNDARCDEHCIYSWWEKFATEFFEDDATIRISGFFSGSARSFVVGRSMIGRFFRYCFENGLVQLQYLLRQPVNCCPRPKSFIVVYPNTCVRSEYKLYNLSYEVIVNGSLELEFSFNCSRIKAWFFDHSNFRELIDKDSLRMYSKSEQHYHLLYNNVTDNGLPHIIIQFLEMNTVMESMRSLMVHSRSFGLGPMDSLRALVMQSQRNQLEYMPPAQLNSVESAGSVVRPTSAQSETFEGYTKKTKKPARKMNTPAPRTQKRKPRKTGVSETPPANESPHLKPLLAPSPCAPNVLLVTEPKLYVMDRMSGDTKTIHRVGLTLDDSRSVEEMTELPVSVVKEEVDDSGERMKVPFSDNLFDDDGAFDCFGDLV